jgi:hypothetical protein
MTNSIVIADIVIHQDADDRYSINDLHKLLEAMTISNLSFGFGSIKLRD